jgi:hypothetical protein
MREDSDIERAILSIFDWKAFMVYSNKASINRSAGRSDA